MAVQPCMGLMPDKNSKKKKKKKNNLGIKTTMTNSKQMKDVMGTIAKIILLVKYSTKR